MPYLSDRLLFCTPALLQTNADRDHPKTGQSSAAAAVGVVWQDTAHCHLSASMAAPVPVPSMPALVHAEGAIFAHSVLTNLCPNQYLHEG